jgi:hypothetical protein
MTSNSVCLASVATTTKAVGIAGSLAAVIVLKMDEMN